MHLIVQCLRAVSSDHDSKILFTKTGIPLTSLVYTFQRSPGMIQYVLLEKYVLL
jgi:hypothetical protein